MDPVDPKGEPGATESQAPVVTGELVKRKLSFPPGMHKGKKGQRGGYVPFKKFIRFMSDRAPNMDPAIFDKYDLVVRPERPWLHPDGTPMSRLEVCYEVIYRIAIAPPNKNGGLRQGQMDALRLIMEMTHGKPNQKIAVLGLGGDDDDDGGENGGAAMRDPVSMTSEARILEIQRLLKAAGGTHATPNESGGTGSGIPRAAVGG